MENEKQNIEAILSLMPDRTPALQPVLLQAEPEPLEIDLKRTAVVVIDMQNCFVSNGGMFDLWGCDISRAQRIVEPVKRIISTARRKELKVVSVVHVYSPILLDTGGPNSPNWYKDKALSDYLEYPERRDKLYIRGTWGAQIVDELQPGKDAIFVEKPRYNAFAGTGLDNILRTHNIKYLVFVGVATNICVDASIRAAYDLEYFAILVSDATANTGPKFVQDAVEHSIKECYGWVTTTENIEKAMEQS